MWYTYNPRHHLRRNPHTNALSDAIGLRFTDSGYFDAWGFSDDGSQLRINRGNGGIPPNSSNMSWGPLRKGMGAGGGKR